MSDPEVIGHYRLLAPIAEGSMGKVYLVEHEVTRRKLALKLLRPEMFGDERARQRFLQEAQGAGIEHPNLIQITDAGEDDGRLYIVMRYVRGADLGKTLRSGPLSPEAAANVLSQIASALDASHAARLIHRDVKPSNILVTSEDDPEGTGHAFLCDFGITKDAAGPALTQTGFAPGTRAYMAPELFKGRDIAGTSDQYALACVAFETLTGRRPFEAVTEEALMYQHLSEDPPAASSVNRRLGPEIDSVLAKAMAKDPSSRYPTCVAFTDALRDAIEAMGPSEPPADVSETPTVIPTAPTTPPAVPRRRTAPIAAAIIFAILVGGMGAFLVVRSRDEPPPVPEASPAVTPSSIATPSPSSPSPSPEPVMRTADARMQGPYQLTLRYSDVQGLTSNTGSPFWNHWPMVMDPVCAKAACDVKIAFQRFGVIARGTLHRDGARYEGPLKTYGITTCNGNETTGDLRLVLTVDDTQLIGSRWIASTLTGEMAYSTNTGPCIPASWTAGISATHRALS